MPLAEARGRIFSFPELRNSKTFKGIPGLLADVLPDKLLMPGYPEMAGHPEV